MILGFAHITKNVSVEDGRRVTSSSAKWPLMACRPTSHHLILRDERVKPPMEFVAYDTSTVKQPSRLLVSHSYIVMKARNDAIESDFLRRGLGFTPLDGGHLELNSGLPHWFIEVAVIPDDYAPIDPPLDIAGYAALAFYSTDVEADRDHLLKHGGRTPTEPFTVKLDREMKIVMLRSPEGTIIELIQVLK